MRQTDQPTHIYTLGPISFLYNTCMNKYCICILYCYFTRFPDGQRREKRDIKGGKEACPIIRTVETSGGRRKEGAQCLNLSIWSSTLRQINPSQIGRKRQKGGRAEGGPGGAACKPHQLVVRLGRLQVVGWFVLLAGLFSVCNLLVLLPSSLPG